MADKVWKTEPISPALIHVHPLDDLFPHDLSVSGEECHCRPQIVRESNGTIIVHNAYDGRDLERFFAARSQVRQ